MATSRSLHRWRNGRSAELDEIAAAHASVGGSERGRRVATRQINHAYAVLLWSQFQGFCRDLHSKCSEALVGDVPADLRSVVRLQFRHARKLDRGNPNKGNLGSDFGRFGVSFWDEVHAVDLRNAARGGKLDRLNLWRNAIAHQDWSQVGGDPSLRLAGVNGWRNAVHALAPAFDRVMRERLHVIRGVPGW